MFFAIQVFLDLRTYVVNVGTHKKTAESENHVNRGKLVVLKGRKIG